MAESYTQEAGNYFFDFFDHELHSIWDDIENTPEDTDSAKWKKKIKGIAKEYALSVRFALMRILYSRAVGAEPGEVPDTEDGFTFTWDGHEYHFSPVSIHSAETLSAEELRDYRAAFMDIASYQADFEPAFSEKLILKAMGSVKSTQLTRTEAFMLGHVLGFSLEEMQWFLLRIFDQDESFRYNRSEDVIEAYTFKTDSSWFSWKTAENMKRAYKSYRIAELIAKARGSSPALSIRDCCRWAKTADEIPELHSPVQALGKIMGKADASADELEAFLSNHIDSSAENAELIYKFSANTEALAEMYIDHFRQKGAKDPKRKAQIYAGQMIKALDVSDFISLCRVSDLPETELLSLADEIFSYDSVVTYHQDSAQTEIKFIGTSDMGESLNGIAQRHKLRPDEDELFLEWMIQPNHRYDYPSKTAAEVYRKLAIYAYRLVTGVGGVIIPEEDGEDERTIDCILRALHEGSYYLLCKNGEISEEQCELVASTLLLGNSEISLSAQSDISKAWGIVTTKNTGEATASGTINANRMRVMDLLSGKESVQKCDIIYLLFFIFNLSWQLVPNPDDNMICNRVFDYVEAAAECLEEALLPEFYPPHLLEQAILLSIVSAENAAIDEEDNIPTGAGPAQTYSIICESLRETRNRKKQG